MKQHISIKQLHEYIRPGGTWDATAIDKSFKALGLPDDKILTADLFTIGKMIEILYSNYCDLYIQAIGCGWEVEYMCHYYVVETPELVDALWEAVKEAI